MTGERLTGERRVSVSWYAASFLSKQPESTRSRRKATCSAAHAMKSRWSTNLVSGDLGMKRFFFVLSVLFLVECPTLLAHRGERSWSQGLADVERRDALDCAGIARARARFLTSLVIERSTRATAPTIRRWGTGTCKSGSQISYTHCWVSTRSCGT